MDPRSMFRGPLSLRFRTERRWFWINLWLAPVTAGFVGVVVLRQQFRTSEIGLLIVLAMVYVTLARGRLLGTSVRVHERQLPRVMNVARRCAQMLEVPEPLVFVRDDPQVPITAMGLGEPYAIVISSQWLPYFDDDELEFLIGRELGHIAAGHTRLTSLFSASGKENPLVALVFGPWLRRTEYTADRVGLLCSRSIEAATRAIYACSFRELKRDVDLGAFIDQRHAIAAEPSLAMGEWLGESPYAVNRLSELARFKQSDLCRHWETELDRVGRVSESADAAMRQPSDASFMLRTLAFGVDLVIVGAIIGSSQLAVNHTASQALTALSADPDTARLGRWLDALRIPLRGDLQALGTFLVMIYSAVVVPIVGRTFGMMLFDLRVVRSDHVRPSTLRVLWRYTLGFLSFLLIVPILIGLASGWWMHDHWSGTRLVRGSTLVRGR